MNGTKTSQQLAGEPLALGLHAFYASHKTAFPMWPKTLKGLMNRESMQESKWRSALETALAKVQTATGWPQCEVVKAGPYEGKVVVRPGATRRSLAKRAQRGVAANDEVVQNQPGAQGQKGS